MEREIGWIMIENAKYRAREWIQYDVASVKMLSGFGYAFTLSRITTVPLIRS